jgi:hypothetical protein
MVPNVAKAGTSFKGAFAYYLHDKREEGEEQTLSSDRVEWTATRNLATDDPDMAWKVMAATAQDQDRLKAQAGVKNTGRRSPNSVYAYSIAWHPEEAGKISKAEMLRAADESLRAIGAQDHQAVFVAHNDEPHPHVHVIVNRVSMEDGRMLSTSNDFRKLDAWALSYRQARGEEQKYCPARAEKAAAKEATKRGEKVDFVRGERSVPRGMEKDFNQAKAANQNEAKTARDREKAKDAALGVVGRSQAHRHKREWVDLGERYQFKKRQINMEAAQAKKDAEAQIKEKNRPLFVELRRNQYKEQQHFANREKSTFGKIENTLYVVANRRHIDPDNARGLMGHAFNFLTSKKARADALDKLHRIELKNLRFHERQEVLAAKRAIDDDKSGQITRAGKTFNAERIALIEKQAEEKKTLQAKWKQRNQERRRAFDTVVKKAQVKDRAPEQTVKPDFAKAASNRRRGKGRSRKRTRD